MKYLKSMTIALLMTLFFIACTKTPHSSLPSGEPVVYISGTESKTGGMNQAVYWKNGSLVELTENSESVATNIVVSGNDVYVAGKIGTSIGYWKNGIFDSLGVDENTNVQIAVFGNDIYLVSSSVNGTTYSCGVYKNGIYTVVPPGNSNPALTSIAVGDQGILLGGSTEGFDGAAATYWLNNMEHILTDGPKFSSVTGVAFAQTDIYVAGREASLASMGKRNVAEYWKNDTVHILSDTLKDNSFTSGIAVSQNDVYVSGTSILLSASFGHEMAKYWKNNISYALTDSLSDCEATAITVAGSDVYVVVQDVGSLPNFPVAKYFKNGKEVDLTDGSFNASASGIYVQSN